LRRLRKLVCGADGWIRVCRRSASLFSFVLLFVLSIVIAGLDQA
jgi:hypothetical protein